MKTKINAQIVAHSVNEQGDELISVLATFPRIILAEVNTHRMLSKNTSSSRAIPFKKMIQAVGENPFVPIAFQKAHSGMQGTEYLDESHSYQAKLTWLAARDLAIEQAIDLSVNIGATKQLCNRLLEPFMWTTMLITGPKSGWDNFFNLRCPQYNIGEGKFYKSKKDALKDVQNRGIDTELAEMFTITDFDWLKANKGQAEIHIMELAECIWDAYNESTPKVLIPGEWHIPFLDKIETDFEEIAVKVSTAMAARTSYTVVGNEKEIDVDAMVVLHDRLLAQDPPHSSPLEHCARAMSDEEYYEFNNGRMYPIDTISNEGDETTLLTTNNTEGWCRNFRGFIPYRYMVDNGKVD